MTDDIFQDADIIDTYSRKEAIEDGTLVDMTQEPFGQIAREAGIKWPVAMTAAAFDGFVDVSDTKGHSCQDAAGRFLEVVRMFRVTRRETSPLEARWTLLVRDPDGRRRRKELKCISGPDDDGEPCLTFMLPDED